MTMTITLPDFDTGGLFPCTLVPTRTLDDGTVIGQATPTTCDSFGPVPVVVYPDGEIMTSIDWQTEAGDDLLDDLEDAAQRNELNWMRARDGKTAYIVCGLPRVLE